MEVERRFAAVSSWLRSHSRRRSPRHGQSQAPWIARALCHRLSMHSSTLFQLRQNIVLNVVGGRSRLCRLLATAPTLRAAPMSRRTSPRRSVFTNCPASRPPTRCSNSSSTLGPETAFSCRLPIFSHRHGDSICRLVTMNRTISLTTVLPGVMVTLVTGGAVRAAAAVDRCLSARCRSFAFDLIVLVRHECPVLTLRLLFS